MATSDEMIGQAIQDQTVPAYIRAFLSESLRRDPYVSWMDAQHATDLLKVRYEEHKQH